jgi:hypothetical protein
MLLVLAVLIAVIAGESLGGRASAARGEPTPMEALGEPGLPS